MVCGLGRGNRSKSVEFVCGSSRSGTALGYFGIMRRLKVRSSVGLVFTALLLSGCSGVTSPEIWLRWSNGSENPSAAWSVEQIMGQVYNEKGSENPEDECPSRQVIKVKVNDPDDQYKGPLNLELTLYINDEETQDPVEHSSTFVKTSRTTGYFDLTVGKTLPRQLVRSGSNRLDAEVSEDWKRSDEGEPLRWGDLQGSIYVSDCDEEQVMSSSAAPESAAETAAAEPDTETSAEPDNDVEQPVSNLKAEFHFGKTSGCPFMQVVDVAGVADNADVSLKLSIDGTSVDNTAEFITEGEYVEEGFDGYFDLVAGDDFKTELEGEHTLKVEVSDGVGSVEIEGKFTADSC